MNDLMNDRCSCTNCPKNGCQCGCQSAMTAAPVSYAGMQCACGSPCNCEGAEQGCLCLK